MKDVMAHEEKVIVYTLGLLESGLKTGLVKGGRLRIDEAGKKEFEKLKAEGFRPTPTEIEIAYTLLSDPPEEIRKASQNKQGFFSILIGKIKNLLNF